MLADALEQCVEEWIDQRHPGERHAGVAPCCEAVLSQALHKVLVRHRLRSLQQASMADEDPADEHDSGLPQTVTLDDATFQRIKQISATPIAEADLSDVTLSFDYQHRIPTSRGDVGRQPTHR